MTGRASNMLAPLALAAAALAFAGPAAAAQADHVTAENAHALVSPRHAGGGAFMTLRNGADDPAVVTSAKAPVGSEVYLERCRRPGQAMRPGAQRRTERIDELEIPANGSVTLQRAGRHICISGETHGFAPGRSFPLTLGFADGSELVVQVEITGVAQPMMGQGGGQGAGRQGDGRQ